jgi:RNA polymerase sigma-70 factor (ECF subfamily)
VTVDPVFQALYEREFALVFRAVQLLSGDPVLAEDATQEAFARALARWRRLRSHPAPGGWIATTALNVARRQLRRRDPPAIEGERPLQTDLVQQILVREAIRSLPPRQLEAVALHYLMDLPVRETADAMGVDVGTVKTHLHRARATLSRTLGEPNASDADRSADHAG